jgi:hypothetical protein
LNSFSDFDGIESELCAKEPHGFGEGDRPDGSKVNALVFCERYFHGYGVASYLCLFKFFSADVELEIRAPHQRASRDPKSGQTWHFQNRRERASLLLNVQSSFKERDDSIVRSHPLCLGLDSKEPDNGRRVSNWLYEKELQGFGWAYLAQNISKCLLKRLWS